MTQDNKDQTEVIIEQKGGRLMFREAPTGIMIEADPGTGIWKEIGIVTVDELDHVRDHFPKSSRD